MFRSGQYFLVNQSAVKKITEALALQNGDVVIEIGAGHGELTHELRITNNELRIIAIEKDGELAGVLRKKFTQDKNMEIIEGDALKLFPGIIHNSLFIIHPYKLVGNIPYYITGKLLRLISELERKPSLCVFTLQKEVAERLTSGPPQMNRLAASVQFWATPEIIADIPRNNFKPAPKVDSTVVRIASSVKGPRSIPTSRELRGRQGSRDIAAERYYRAVRILFQQPRKTILNNLAVGIKMDKKTLAKKLEKTGVDPNARPQNLSIEDIIRIAEF